jgi:hypothetical protein
LPEIDILVDCLLQLISVQEDQFAGEDDQSFAFISVESFEAVIKQLGQFARIRGSRRVIQFAGRIEGYSRFGGIGDNETHFRLFGQSDKGIVIRIWI